MSLPEPSQPSDPPKPDTPSCTWSSSIAPKIVSFKDLARCGEEIWIEHEGKLYRLQSTRQGKLVLTK